MRSFWYVVLCCTLFLQAMEKFVESQVAAALQELANKELVIKKRYMQVVGIYGPATVPDLFGVARSSCLLPEGLKCSQNPLTRRRYLDAIYDHELQKALVINCLGYMMKTNTLSEITAPLLVGRYGVRPCTIEGVNEIKKI